MNENINNNDSLKNLKNKKFVYKRPIEVEEGSCLDVAYKLIEFIINKIKVEYDDRLINDCVIEMALKINDYASSYTQDVISRITQKLKEEADKAYQKRLAEQQQFIKEERISE